MFATCEHIPMLQNIRLCPSNIAIWSYVWTSLTFNRFINSHLWHIKWNYYSACRRVLRNAGCSPKEDLCWIVVRLSITNYGVEMENIWDIITLRCTAISILELVGAIVRIVTEGISILGSRVASFIRARYYRCCWWAWRVEGIKLHILQKLN